MSLICDFDVVTSLQKCVLIIFEMILFYLKEIKLYKIKAHAVKQHFQLILFYFVCFCIKNGWVVGWGKKRFMFFEETKQYFAKLKKSRFEN